MSTTVRRQFKKGETVYLVDCCGTSGGPQAFETRGKVVEVEEEAVFVETISRGRQKYNVNDYKRLIFDTMAEASDAAKALPRPNSIIYKKNEDGTLKEIKTNGIWHGTFGGIYNLTIKLEGCEEITTDKIGKEIFLSKESANA